MKNVKTTEKYGSLKTSRFISLTIIHVVLVVLAIIWLYPMFWILLSAFRVEYNDQGNLIGIVVSH